MDWLIGWFEYLVILGSLILLFICVVAYEKARERKQELEERIRKLEEAAKKDE